MAERDDREAQILFAIREGVGQSQQDRVRILTRLQKAGFSKDEINAVITGEIARVLRDGPDGGR